jgi:hypothetical protein
VKWFPLIPLRFIKATMEHPIWLTYSVNDSYIGRLVAYQLDLLNIRKEQFEFTQYVTLILDHTYCLENIKGYWAGLL